METEYVYMKVKSIQNYSPFDGNRLVNNRCPAAYNTLLIQYYIIFIYIYKYNHYNYHWKDLQCASLKVLFHKRNARTIEMRSHNKKLAYGLRGSTHAPISEGIRYAFYVNNRSHNVIQIERISPDRPYNV
jgi:hypothetical protein